MKHAIVGNEFTPKTKTQCGRRVEDIARGNDFFVYAQRKHVDCPECLAKLAKIERMRDLTR